MQMRPEVQLKSVIKALTDVVIPAMDSENKLAMEQVQLCIGLLSQMNTHLPRQFAFDVDELTRLCALADSIESIAVGGEQTQSATNKLKLVSKDARSVLEAAGKGPEKVLQSVRQLRSSVGAVITAAGIDGTDESGDQISAVVLESSQAQLLRDRSWLIAQGFEPEPEKVPPIDRLLEEAFE